jgi:hypothetical protein
MKRRNRPNLKIGLLVVVLAFLSAAVYYQSTTPKIKPLPTPSIPPTLPPPVVVPPPIYSTPSGRAPQFVVMAFDGSYSLDMWQQTLDFAKLMQDQNHPVHFTYFLSGVYFLNYRKAVRYEPPTKAPGTSLIGFGASNLDVEERVKYVNRAIAEGHEIGSHANGHFDGADWTYGEWEQELTQFNNLVFHIVGNNDVSSKDAGRYTVNLNPGELVGFRAPSLARNDKMYTALLANGYKYDTSATGKATEWPQKLNNGLWEFPVASIQYSNTSSFLLAMDYNFYFKQSGGKDVTKKGEGQWQQFYQDTYTSYINYFQKNYTGNRAPVYIGSHFSEWNDGVYWDAMRDFGADVCIKPEVYCVTFKDLMGYLNSKPKP